MLPSIITPLQLLSEIITPTILILATNSMVLATSNRQGRVLERMRSLAERDARGSVILFGYMSRRAFLLQNTLFLLYVSLCAFCLTSVSIGIDALYGQHFGFVYIFLALCGVVALLVASIMLGIESYLAVGSVRLEVKELLVSANSNDVPHDSPMEDRTPS